MLVVIGKIKDGEVRAGMLLSISTNDSTALKAPITSLEFVNKIGGGSDLGLTIKMPDDEEVATWQASLHPDQVVEIVEPEDCPP